MIGRWRDLLGGPLRIPARSRIHGDRRHRRTVAYLEKNEPQVIKTVASKLVGYALGRTVLASDMPLIEELSKAGGDATFADLAADIATSRQFRFIRVEAPPQVAATAKITDRKGEE
jgi:hypothetical protein